MKGRDVISVTAFSLVNGGLLVAMFGVIWVVELVGGMGQGWEGSSHARPVPPSLHTHLQDATPWIVRFWTVCLLYSIVVSLARKKVDVISAIGLFVFVATFLLDTLAMSLSGL